MSERASNIELERILLALSESLLTASDEEILDELPHEEDPVALAEEVRANLLRAVQTYKHRKLATARAAYEERLRELAEEGPPLPESADERRSLLRVLLARHPTLVPGVLTAQYRNLRDVPDEDIQSLLIQLHKLGAFEDDEGDA